MTAIKFKTESIVTVADEKRRGPLTRFLAAHTVGIANAVVAGHEMVWDGVGINYWDTPRASVFSGHIRCVRTTDFTVSLVVFN